MKKDPIKTNKSSRSSFFELPDNSSFVPTNRVTDNDFLFRNQRLQTLDQTLQSDPISASHGQLWDRCGSDIKRLDTPPTSEQYMRHSNDNSPFLLCAASYAFDSAEKALSGGAM
jgi:hypothetical protein